MLLCGRRVGVCVLVYVVYVSVVYTKCVLCVACVLLCIVYMTGVGRWGCVSVGVCVCCYMLYMCVVYVGVCCVWHVCWCILYM